MEKFAPLEHFPIGDWVPVSKRLLPMTVIVYAKFRGNASIAHCVYCAQTQRHRSPKATNRRR